MNHKNVLLVTLGLQLGSDFSGTVKVSWCLCNTMLMSEGQNGY